MRELRPRLRRIWEVDEDEVVRIVNECCARLGRLPQLVRHDEWSYHLHATPPAAPLATRMAVEAAMAIVDVVRSERTEPAAHLRIPDLQRRRRRPVEEPVETVLRGRLRQPRGGGRLPCASGGSHGLVTHPVTARTGPEVSAADVITTDEQDMIP